MTVLEIKNLHVSVEGKEILKGLNLTIKSGEVQALMGPNGSGKSTLAYTILGNPHYKITDGDILLDGESILEWTTDIRAKKGLFLAFQYPHEISGVTVFNFLRTAYNSMKLNGQIKDKKQELVSVLQFQKILKEKISLLGINDDILKRYLNEGFSGGEKKRCEILQMAVLEPSFAVLDETDSGLDIDALRTVATGINKLSGPSMGVLLITHYNRVLKYIKPHRVHIMIDGKIVKSGGQQLAEELEERGYDWVTNGGNSD